MSPNRARLVTLTVAPLAAALALSACSSGSGGKPKDTALMRAAAVARPAVPRADLDATAAGTADFGLDMLRKLGATDQGDIMVSPASLAAVLGMLLPGAKGQTAQQMQKVLHTTLSAGQYADALGALNASALQHGLDSKADMQQFDTLWVLKDYGIQQSYLDTLSAAFDTGVHQADFGTAPESARQLINQTVQDQTKGLIKDPFPKDSIDSNTRLVLTDARYLKADWASPFKPGHSFTSDFTLLDGSKSTVKMMNQEQQYRYTTGDGWQYAEIPYQGDRLAMDIVLPDAGKVAQVRDHLDAATLTSAAARATEQEVSLTLPKFTFDSSATVNDQLKQLGMTDLFDPSAADLSGIPAKPDPLYVSLVVEKTHVAVDEQGTTAAAAAGAVVEASSGQAALTGLVQMNVDRPFLFLIRDTGTGQVLFLGQVTRPPAPGA